MKDAHIFNLYFTLARISSEGDFFSLNLSSMNKLVIPFSRRYMSLLLLGLISAMAAQAQTLTITGRVVDATNKQPLTGVQVTAPSLKAGTFTDDEGGYSLEMKPGSADSLTMVISLSSYVKREVRIRIKGATTLKRDFDMFPEDYSTDDVVITASRGFAQERSGLTASVEVVKQEAIDRQATFSVQNVITQVPGVDMVGDQINIRGSSGYAYGVGSRVNVLLDGLPLLSGDAGFPELSLVPVDNLNQVEVIKGASSVLYGSGSIGGVINILTSQPGEKPKSSLRLRGAFYGSPANKDLDWDGNSSAYQGSAHFFHSRRIGNLSLTVQTDFNKDSGYRQGTDKEEFRGLLMTRYQPKKLPGLSFGVNMSTRIDSSSNMLFWRSYFPDEVDVSVPGQVDSTVTMLSGGALTPDLSPGVYRRQLNTRLAVDPYIKFLTDKGGLFWYRGRYLRNVNTNTSGQSAQNFLLYNDFMYQQTVFDKFNWTVGATLSYAQANGDSLFQGSKDDSRIGVFSQLDGKIGRLNTSLGVRLETVRVDTLERETLPVFRAGLNYQIAEGTNIRASIGQAYRSASVAERYANTQGGGLLVQATPNLLSETGYSAEIGIQQGFKFDNGYGGVKGYVDVAAFTQRYNNMVEFGLKGLDKDSLPKLKIIPIFTSANVTDARINGIEITANLSANFKHGFFSLNGGITLLDPQNLNPTPAADQLDLTNAEDILENGTLGELLGLITSLQDTTKADAPPILKYRSKRTIRASASIGYKKFVLTTNYRSRSFLENIDQYLFVVIQDLHDFRTQVNSGNDTSVDFILAYKPSDATELSFNLSNAFNKEYLLLPGVMAEQRKFTIQYAVRF